MTMALQYHGGQVPLPASPLPSTLDNLPTTLRTSVPFSTLSALEGQLSTSLSLETHNTAIQPLAEYSEKQRRPHADCPQGSSDLVESWVANALAPEQQMKQAKTKATIGILSTLIAYVSLNSLAHSLRPDIFIWQTEDIEQSRWIASSRSWFDRKACRWLGVCGAAHLKKVKKTFGKYSNKVQSSLENLDNDWDWQDAWNEGRERPEDWSNDERVLREIPQYVMDYAPLVHLFSGEQFWPCDIAEHLYHITPRLNYTSVQPRWQHPALTNLDELNQWDHGRHVFLTSNDNVEERPEWLEGEKNIPNSDGLKDSGDEEAWADWDSRVDGELPEDTSGNSQEWFDAGEGDTKDRGGDRPPSDPNAPVPSDTEEGEDFTHENDDTTANDELRLRSRSKIRKRLVGGRSNAPAVLIVVNKGHGIIDAFWFYFYSFNLGNTVLNVRFGNHVGDWEHTMVRFNHGKPKAVFFSEHSFGEAYRYEAVEKIGVRPVIYSARGSHANYATAGLHPYVLPWGILHDETDRGPLWDPVLNTQAYTYDYITDELRSSNLTPKAPTEWFYFTGHWGDKFYPLGDRRQYRFAGQYHYVNGPVGPRFKNLGRRKMCQGRVTDPCAVRNYVGKVRAKRWRGPGIGDQLTEEDMQRLLGNATRSDMK